MFPDVLEFACLHLDLCDWARVCCTSKACKQAVNTPLYWEVRFGELRKMVTSDIEVLEVYRTRDCVCVGGSVRLVTGSYTISLPVQSGVSTQVFVKQLCVGIQMLNHELLPHMAEARLSLRLATPAGALGTHPAMANMYLAGWVGLTPVWIPEGQSASKERVEDGLTDILEDQKNATWESLAELANELEESNNEIDTAAVAWISQNEGMCPLCSRLFGDRGLVHTRVSVVD